MVMLLTAYTVQCALYMGAPTGARGSRVPVFASAALFNGPHNNPQQQSRRTRSITMFVHFYCIKISESAQCFVWPRSN